MLPGSVPFKCLAVTHGSKYGDCLCNVCLVLLSLPCRNNSVKQNYFSAFKNSSVSLGMSSYTSSHLYLLRSWPLAKCEVRKRIALEIPLEGKLGPAYHVPL